MTATIACCNREHKADRTWLLSSRQQFEYEILFESFCKNCKLPLMGHCYFISAKAGTTAMIKIDRKEHSKWLIRKQVDVFDFGGKDYRFIVFAGQATLRMASDLAKKHFNLKPRVSFTTG